MHFEAFEWYLVDRTFLDMNTPPQMDYFRSFFKFFTFYNSKELKLHANAYQEGKIEISSCKNYAFVSLPFTAHYHPTTVSGQRYPPSIIIKNR